MTNNTPTVGIKPWGISKPKDRTQYENDELPKLKYLKLTNPDVIPEFRIVTGFGTYYQARVSLPKSRSQYGDRVNTAWPQYEKECPVVNKLGLTAKERFKVIVIDRKDGDLKIADISQLTQENIEKTLQPKNARRAEGDKVSPADYDISIAFDPKAQAANMYTVGTFDNEPLSDEDRALIADIGGEEVLNKILTKAIMCPKPEWVEKKLVDMGWDGKAVVSEKEEAQDTKSELEAPAKDDYSFPAEGGTASADASGEEVPAAESAAE